MRRTGSAWAVATAMVVLLAIPARAVATTYTSGWTFSAVAHDDAQIALLAFDGGRLVWSVPSGGGVDLVTELADQPNTSQVVASSAKLATDEAPFRQVSVAGDRIVWEAFDGAHWQVHTRKMGVDSAARQVTNESADHSLTKLSGDRAVWLARVGTYNQVFTMDLALDG